MKAYRKLPEGYRAVLRISLLRNRKTALKISAGSFAALAAVLAAGHLVLPIGQWCAAESVWEAAAQCAVLLFGYLGYVVLHELTHAAVMKAVGGGRVIFGFRGFCAFAGSRVDWFDKSSYLCVALSPLAVWGIAFGALAALVPRGWFWVVWVLQAGNVSGAAGDVYVAARLLKMPTSVLVRDTGTDMTVYDAGPAAVPKPRRQSGRQSEGGTE